MGNIARSIAVPLDGVLPANSEEAALIQELRAGSEEAFAYLLAVYRNPIYNLACHIMRDESDAADVLQNIFVKIIRGIKQFHNGSSLKTWIYRIAVHEALNYRRSWFRRHQREVCSLDDERPAVTANAARASETPYELVEQTERRQLVTRALRSLSEPYRTVVVLREVEDLSYEEIAEILGVAEGTVKSRLKRGRELLRRKLAGCLAPQNWGQRECLSHASKFESTFRTTSTDCARRKLCARSATIFDIVVHARRNLTERKCSKASFAPCLVLLFHLKPICG